MNIDEGTRQDASGRHWEVKVVNAAEAYSERAAGEQEPTERRK